MAEAWKRSTLKIVVRYQSLNDHKVAIAYIIIIIILGRETLGAITAPQPTFPIPPPPSREAERRLKSGQPIDVFVPVFYASHVR